MVVALPSTVKVTTSLALRLTMVVPFIERAVPAMKSCEISPDVSGVPLTLTLGSQMPVLNETYGANSITVTEEGDYEINYGLLGSVNPASTITLAVNVDGDPEESGAISQDFIAGTARSMNGTTIVSLDAGAVVTVTVEGSATTTLTPLNNVNSYLTVKKLNSGSVA